MEDDLFSSATLFYNIIQTIAIFIPINNTVPNNK